MDELGNMMLGGGSGQTSKEFGRSSATAVTGGNTTGLVFTEKTLIVIAIASAAALVIGAVTLWLLLRR